VPGRLDEDRAEVGIPRFRDVTPGPHLPAGVLAGDQPHKAYEEARPLEAQVVGNESLLAPVFYLSAELGLDAENYAESLIGGDERFLFVSSSAGEANYN